MQVSLQVIEEGHIRGPNTRKAPTRNIQGISLQIALDATMTQQVMQSRHHTIARNMDWQSPIRILFGCPTLEFMEVLGTMASCIPLGEDWTRAGDGSLSG